MTVAGLAYIWEVWLDILNAGISCCCFSYEPGKVVPSGNANSNLNNPPSHNVLSLPGIPHSHFFKSRMPAGVRTGFAKKPKG